jgi:Co/Zn/Cd efflux system component
VLVVAVVALIAHFTCIVAFNRHALRHLHAICRGRRTRRGILEALADGILIR